MNVLSNLFGTIAGSIKSNPGTALIVATAAGLIYFLKESSALDLSSQERLLGMVIVGIIPIGQMISRYLKGRKGGQ